MSLAFFDRPQQACGAGIGATGLLTGIGNAIARATAGELVRVGIDPAHHHLEGGRTAANAEGHRDLEAARRTWARAHRAPHRRERSNSFGGGHFGAQGLPVTRQQVVETMLRNCGDPTEVGGQPRLRIDIVEACGGDTAEHERGTWSPAVRSGEEPRLPAEGHSAQNPFGAICGQADAAAVSLGGECDPIARRVDHRLDNIRGARERWTMLDHQACRLATNRAACPWRGARRCCNSWPRLVRSKTKSASISRTASIASGAMTGVI